MAYLYTRTTRPEGFRRAYSQRPHAYPVVSADPKMLRSTHSRKDVPGDANLFIGCRRAPGPKAQQRLKGRHRLLPTIVPRDELIQIDLKLPTTDVMMRPDEPLLKIADRV